jgi:hypothetical protein
MRVIPGPAVQSVDCLSIHFAPSKAEYRNALNQEGYKISSFLGKYDSKTHAVDIWLWNIWKSSLFSFHDQSYEFGVWNEFLRTLYHEFAHAEDCSLSDYISPEETCNCSSGQFNRLWILQDDAAREKYLLWRYKEGESYPQWQIRELNNSISYENRELFARIRSRQMHIHSDSKGLTVPTDLGIFNKMINDHIRTCMKYNSKWASGSHLFFDKVRMHKYRLHHRRKALNSFPFQNKCEGQTVFTKSGQRKVYYRHSQWMRL